MKQSPEEENYFIKIYLLCTAVQDATLCFSLQVGWRKTLSVREHCTQEKVLLENNYRVKNYN